MIEPTDFFVFRVPSRTRPGADHIVDLLAYGGNGQCDCEHFRYRLEPLVSRRPPGENRWGGLHCPHIRQARDWLASRVIADILKLEASRKPNERTASEQNEAEVTDQEPSEQGW